MYIFVLMRRFERVITDGFEIIKHLREKFNFL